MTMGTVNPNDEPEAQAEAHAHVWPSLDPEPEAPESAQEGPGADAPDEPGTELGEAPEGASVADVAVSVAVVDPDGSTTEVPGTLETTEAPVAEGTQEPGGGEA